MTKKAKAKELDEKVLDTQIEDVETEKTEELDENEAKESAKDDETENLKKEVEDLKKKYFYLLAESDNTRKRFEREKENLIKYGNEKILSSLIEVLDNFDHSIIALKDETDEKVKSIKDGMEMIQKQFLSKLHDNGLSRIEALGENFDPKFHEAMCEQVDNDKKAGTVLSEFQKGYSLNGRLLRPSKVVVSKKGEE